MIERDDVGQAEDELAAAIIRYLDAENARVAARQDYEVAVVEAWLADQNERLDALLANSADQGGRHGVTGQTGYIPPVN